MLGHPEHRRCRALLEDGSRVHHKHPVRYRERDAQVVRDQQQRHPPPPLQAPEQLEDLRLGARVERRRRLVGDQQLRIASERGGQRDALQRPAGELERVAVRHVPVAQPHLVQALARLLARERSVPSHLTRERLDDVSPDGLRLD